MPRERTRFQLVPPYIIGDGGNFSNVKLFVVMIQGELSHGDILWIQDESFYLRHIEEVEDDDYFEHYLVLTTSMVTTTGIGFTLDPKKSLEGMVMGVTAPIKNPSSLFKIIPAHS